MVQCGGYGLVDLIAFFGIAFQVGYILFNAGIFDVVNVKIVKQLVYIFVNLI